MRLHRLLLAAAVCQLLAAPQPAIADSDAELWSEVGVRHTLDDSWRVSLDQGLRFDDSMSRFSQSNTEAGVRFRALDWLRFAAAYRFVYRQNLAGEMQVRHRLNADGVVRLRRGRLTGTYRLRLQEQLRGIDASDGSRHALRNRVKLSWRASKKLEPYASTELFVGLGGNSGSEVDKWRATVGTSYAMKKKQLDFFYRLEIPIADPDQLTAHILGVGYSFGI